MLRALVILAAVCAAIATTIRSPVPEGSRHQIPALHISVKERAERTRVAEVDKEPFDLDFQQLEETDVVAEDADDDPVPERRFDEDGGAYTREQFHSFYGKTGEQMWLAAEVAPEDVSYAVELAQLQAEDAKQSALARLRRSAMKEISRLRQVVAETAESAANVTAALAEAAAQFAGFREQAANDLSEAEERAAAAEERAAAALLTAEREKCGREEAEVAAAAAQRAAQEAEAAAAALETAREEAAAASVVALGAAEARVEEQAARALAAEEAQAQALQASAQSDQSQLSQAAVAAAEAEAETLRAQLADAQAEADAATRALAVAEAQAAHATKEVGVWRHRARLWKRRADVWRSKAGGPSREELGAAADLEESDDNLTASQIDALIAQAGRAQRDAMVALAMVAVAERSVAREERDEAISKWRSLLDESKAGALQHTTVVEADALLEVLHGRPAAVWREAEAWAADEIARLKAKYHVTHGQWPSGEGSEGGGGSACLQDEGAASAEQPSGRWGWFFNKA